MFDGLALCVGQVLEGVLEGTKIAHVHEDLLRVGKVLVDVVEVGNHHQTPMDEIVQGFRVRIELLVTGVKGHQKRDALSCLHADNLHQEVVDGDDAR